MRTLTVDVGNTRTKMVLWTDGCPSQWDGMPVDRALASVTGEEPDWAELLPGVAVEILGPDTPLPIGIDYATPLSLGADRKAAACGAWALEGGKACVVVDAGTCITLDLVDANGTYQGGAIMPGIRMKFGALNTFTARLPLLGRDVPTAMPANGLTGKSTAESMTAGVLTATRLEVQAMVDRYRALLGEVAVIVTGGDAEQVAPSGARIEKDLVLVGLRVIAETMTERK